MPAEPFTIVGGNGLGYITNATPGAVFNALLPPRAGCFTRLQQFQASNPADAQIITAMRPLGANYDAAKVAASKLLGATVCTAVGASGQAVINIAQLPGITGHLLQTNDTVAIQETDGVTRPYIVSSVSTLAITLTTNLIAGVAVNSPVWDFGVTSSVNPYDGLAHPNYRPAAAGGVTNWPNTALATGLMSTYYTAQPILLQNNNATAQGWFNYVLWDYTENQGKEPASW